MISQATLVTALFEHAKNMSLGFAVVLPRTEYQPTAQETYLDVAYLPNTSTDLSTGFDGPVWYQGILQIAVMTPANTSLVDSSVIADDVMGFWERGSAIDAGDFRIKFKRQPQLAPSFKDGPWDRLPISISYEVMA